MTRRMHDVQTAADQLQADSIVGVRWQPAGRASREFVGQVQRVMVINSGTDVSFVLIAGSNYDHVDCLLSECDIAPLKADGHPDWANSYTIESVRHFIPQLDSLSISRSLDDFFSGKDMGPAPDDYESPGH